MEQDAFLQGSQRIDILYIAHPTGSMGNDSINLRLRQRNQRQHIRGDGGGAIRNAVRWHHKSLGVTPDNLCHISEDRSGEHTANLELPANVAQLLNQTDDHQRMTTEFKEMVMTTDLLQP
ncbi:hypothetical protein Xbed_03495 [Xenorhabdus beddingii]|uniref:Uncharacterized protein n=1 Tax=Xenorhabdus beddingii TaxID=40578 RepID=A0A1Y2SCG2_9GAMM|nr:hypothetical protein Xbed_03495 [Xenorhabdus beddingii]